MKAGIHPEYKQITITCACGNVIETRSTKTDNFSIDICSNCHPYYTGKERAAESKGQVEKFRKKFGSRANN